MKYPEYMNEPKSVNDDPVIDEIRRIRKEYSVQFHGDLRAIVEEMRKQHADDGRPEITRPPKRFSQPQSQTLKPVESA